MGGLGYVACQIRTGGVNLKQIDQRKGVLIYCSDRLTLLQKRALRFGDTAAYTDMRFFFTAEYN
jgi:hypothetical protein